MTSTGTWGPTVLVTSDPSLIAETVGAALTSHGFGSRVVALEPDGGRVDLPPRSETAEAGLLISDLETYRSIEAARAMLARLDLPWVVVTASRCGPVWGALIECGAARVVESTVSIGQITRLLESLVLGTHVRDRELEDDLLRQWREFRLDRSAVGARLTTLTSWERTVLTSLFGGGAVHEIAARHDVTEEAILEEAHAALVRLDLGPPLTAVSRLAELLLLDPEGGTTG